MTDTPQPKQAAQSGSDAPTCSAWEKIALVYSVHCSRKLLWYPLRRGALEWLGQVFAVVVGPFLFLWLLWLRVVSGPISDIRRPLSPNVLAAIRREIRKQNAEAIRGATVTAAGATNHTPANDR
jgi:hypothetical protein